MKILFLDQSGGLGGAELCLLDIAKLYRASCLVGLFAAGPFEQALQQHQIPVAILTSRAIPVRKESNLLQGMSSLGQWVPLAIKVAKLSRRYDLIYANTQKALVIGALASTISQRPLIYHLHDILSSEHFSAANRRIAITLANRRAKLVIANSRATETAFVAAGGKSALTQVIYNGFEPTRYLIDSTVATHLRQELGLSDCFVVGHFSRLSPWKGQHILIEALTYCPEQVVALLVGDDLFGEQDYVQCLHQQVAQLGLGDRVRFLGFRADIPQLMAACDLITHTSTAAEPFGRVIVEAMLSGRPIVATAAGGAVELVESGMTGWLVPPANPQKLATVINQCREHPQQARAIAQQAQRIASQRFNLTTINQQVAQALAQVV